MKTAVITTASGRHDHLARQWQGLATGSELPDDYVVVAIADPAIADLVIGGPVTPRVTHLATSPTGLPLAQARNLGAAKALSAGAEVLIFLDVDCIPSPQLLRRYRHAAGEPGQYLLCGPVAYLPPALPGGYPMHDLSRLASPHPARPAPAETRIVDTEDHALFWSLSFAVTASTWETLGGFCEDYTGYGGEDTDFGETARQAGVRIRWIGGATAFHQYHSISDPPVEHLDDILRNATTFHRRWGWWPMTGWLTEFERRHLIRFIPKSHRWERTTQ